MTAAPAPTASAFCGPWVEPQLPRDGRFVCAYCRKPVDDAHAVRICTARASSGLPLVLHKAPPTPAEAMNVLADHEMTIVDIDELERRLYMRWRTGLVARLVRRAVAARREGDARKADILDEVAEALKE